MKNILISFFALILFISCQTTSGVIQEKTVTVIIVPDTDTDTDTDTNIDTRTEAVVYSGLVLPNGVSTRNTERGKILVSDKKIIFEFGKSTLPKDATYVLRDVVKYILDNNPNVRIVLEAHTSNRGISYPYNYALSLERSAVGEKYLSTLGVTSERLMTKSYGESLPEYPLQKNLRRYEFVVIENENDLMRYNKFFSTINAQTDTTYSIYIKRVEAYEQRNTEMVYDEMLVTEDEVFTTENKVFADEDIFDAKEVFSYEEDKANAEDEVFTVDVDMDDDEFIDDEMFIDDAMIIN